MNKKIVKGFYIIKFKKQIIGALLLSLGLLAGVSILENTAALVVLLENSIQKQENESHVHFNCDIFEDLIDSKVK